jgi:hypothetical protein
MRINIFKYLSYCVLVICINLIFSKVSQTQEVHLTTQAQIDSFPINYPGLTHYNGTLFISGSEIVNLQDLCKITGDQRLVLNACEDDILYNNLIPDEEINHEEDLWLSK